MISGIVALWAGRPNFCPTKIPQSRVNQRDSTDLSNHNETDWGGMHVTQCSEHEMIACRRIHENEGLFIEEHDVVTREQIVLMTLPKRRSSFLRILLKNGTARYDDISTN